jgi:predicted RNase H-like HicB family nuclease
MIGYITFRLPYTIKKKRDYYLVHCPLIDIYSQGETEVKAISNLKEAINLFLISCIERGTFEKVMAECGAQIVSKTLTKVPEGKRFINIPFPITTDCAQKVCHA